MNSEYHQKHLDELADFFSKKFSKKELCRRIAEALYIQDSCGTCEALNIKAMLQTGDDGYMFCEKCMKDEAFISFTHSGDKNE